MCIVAKLKQYKKRVPAHLLLFFGQIVLRLLKHKNGRGSNMQKTEGKRMTILRTTPGSTESRTCKLLLVNNRRGMLDINCAYVSISRDERWQISKKASQNAILFLKKFNLWHLRRCLPTGGVAIGLWIPYKTCL